MTFAKLIHGAPIAEALLQNAERQIREIRRSGGSLTLATVQVGQAKDTVLYSNYLSRLLKKLGIQWIPNVFPENETEKTILKKIKELNRNPDISGIMIFSPLPKRLNAANILNFVDLLKDVEGRTFLKSHYGVFSPTAHAVLALIESKMPHLAGKQAVVIGHSDIVGKPTAVLLMDKMATVTVCHARTRRIERIVAGADILVAAAGRANLVKGRWIKKGALVIDVGENIQGGKLVGDVEFESARRKASYISPVPGGVGPVTNVMLVRNLITLRKIKESMPNAC